MPDSIPTCRGCGKVLKGSPYWHNGTAYNPDTNERARVCFYGGWVCSKLCDIRACNALEATMPGCEPSSVPMCINEINRKWA